MQFLLETDNTLEHRLIIIVPAAEVELEVKKRLQLLGKRVRIDGFRPGKVPLKELKRRYGIGARQEALGEVMQQSYMDALEESKLEPAAPPEIEMRVDKEGQDLEFVAKLETLPEIELKDINTIEIEQLAADVKDSDIDKVVSSLREQHKIWEEASETAVAETDDKVLIDYVGSIDEEEFKDGSAEDETFILGSGQAIPGFEDGLLGSEKNEKRVLDLTFPEDYDEAFRGKHAQFAVTVKSIQRSRLPDLNDEFFAKFGIREGGEEKFRKEVLKNMEMALKKSIRSKTKEQVLNGLLHLNKISVPNALIKQEINELRQNFAANLRSQMGGKQEQEMDHSKLPDTLFKSEAERRVTLGLIINKIIQEKNIRLDTERMQEMIREIAAAYQSPQAVEDMYNSDDKRLEQCRYAVMEEQAIDAILESANITIRHCSYDEAVKTEEKNNDNDSNQKDVSNESKTENNDKNNNQNDNIDTDTTE